MMRATAIRPHRALAFALSFIAASGAAHAQLAGRPFIHDPATITESDGRYYTFGTRGGGLVSDDGWKWVEGPVRPGGGVAPDVIKLGDRYYVAYAVGGGGLNGGHASQIRIMWTRSLDPESPDFGYHDIGVVASTDGTELADAIDAAFLLAEGRLWLSYGTYFGSIRMVELDPDTAMPLPDSKPVDVAIDMEATAMMFRDGWYYLLGTHGTCCDGPNSTYNIRVGRSRTPTGPYVDNMGIPLLKGGGKLVANARGRGIGPGHFGLIDLGQGVQKFSMHYEADMDRGGRSVLAIAPLLWRDGWPVEGENIAAGTYEIESERSGRALQLATDFVRIDFDARRSFMAKPDTVVPPVPDQSLKEDSADWPDGKIAADLGDYMVRPHQLWTVTPVPEKGGWFGAPCYRITIAGTQRALAAGPASAVSTVPAYDGSDDQLWQIDQLADGSYRIRPAKAADKSLALVAIGASTPVLVPFDPESDSGRWRFRHR
ncbi:family 43 glycosylhydrolase [Stakelama pacifica]|uniref:Arabinan endo-1,5-alpha-L-arabinosidase n=1 Tax=Stakelama pacifica TaxID=517720 RepID=A0A4R6FNM6_9SPHN|nr:family 43 glycosylhydrolase [Stakelama pacifica]TDN82275.1 arabinan endo-1,5-alpha-L-arabinosidase [Stakelama pacifica]GGO95783.1 hypothetical protein GCM10011329_20740 [Stakelama pacifica]